MTSSITNNEGSELRTKEIDRIRNDLQNNIGTRRRLCGSYKKVYNGLHFVTIGSTSIAVALSGVIVSNPILGLPFGVTNIVLGTR